MNTQIIYTKINIMKYKIYLLFIHVSKNKETHFMTKFKARTCSPLILVPHLLERATLPNKIPLTENSAQIIGRASLAQLFKIKLDKKYFRNS